MTIENTVQAIEARLGSQLRRIDSLPEPCRTASRTAAGSALNGVSRSKR